ncbi:MAG TPA: phosphoribosylamine--glycine ligase [Acetobacteraceae bacterium]|nr:phosphoribosylamine--glycine ligase [Acetobacteraceae bacterium]
MRVLIVGSGGREHALAVTLAASPLLTRLYVAPGNPGTARVAQNVPIGVTDIVALVTFAKEHAIDLVMPGPEAPLVAGLADALERAGIACCGPTAAAAQLEGSKSFTKEVCDAAGIPTALWERFDDAAAARDFVRRRGAPIVVKADGLAAGKGVVVAMTVEEAEAAIAMMMEGQALGEAGATVVIEEFLEGDEVSLFALCDGTDAVLIGAAQDHKRIGDGDTGPNTGGMGAVSPPAGFGLEAQHAALDLLICPALREMARRGTPFRGVLFAGLMLTASGPKLIEYNVRFGDPETQALLPRLRSDLLPALLAACQGELGAFDLRLRDVASVAVVMAARGYPGTYVKGSEIRGIERAEALPDVRVFHAGTEQRDGTLLAVGGRVLTVCATGPDLSAARDAAYAGVAAIDWPEGIWRRDIGLRALKRGAEL